MRKRNVKSFIGGMVVMLLILSLIGTVAAATTSKSAQLVYKDIKITLNGNMITPKDANGNTVEPFIINGTTYLPVRAVGEALGLDVQWDGTTNTVKLNNQSAITNGTIVYDDKYVTIAFDSIQESKYYSSDAVFNVTNKTDYELTFQASAISFDGVSYNVSCSDEVAPNSTGKIYCSSSDKIPYSVSTTSGKIRVVDFGGELLDLSYDATWSGK